MSDNGTILIVCLLLSHYIFVSLGANRPINWLWYKATDHEHNDISPQHPSVDHIICRSGCTNSTGPSIPAPKKQRGGATERRTANSAEPSIAAANEKVSR